MDLKKHGFTLVEIIIVMSIFSILVSIMLVWLNMSSIYYNKNMKENIENIRSEDAFLFIERQINNSYNVSVNSDILNINLIEKGNKKPLFKSECIKYENGNLVIRYMENGNFACENNIIKNIKQFNIKQETDIIFITITFHDEREYTRCLKIKN